MQKGIGAGYPPKNLITSHAHNSYNTNNYIMDESSYVYDSLLFMKIFDVT